MDADVLSEALRHMPGIDPSCMTFLEAFVRRQACLENGVRLSDAPAVQAGSPLCGFLENAYLREMDFVLAEKAAVCVARRTQQPHLPENLDDPLA